MTTVPVPDESAEAPLFADGLGERVVVADGATGELLQILRLRPALTAVTSFEFALRERAARLANFRHAYYARVRRIDRATAHGSTLAIVSDHIEGTRLSDLLRVAYERRLQIDVNTALCLIRQLVPAVSLLHENAREVAHGLIAPERILVTPHARLVMVEHVLAGAVEQLQFGRDRLWQEFRIALPSTAGPPRFDHRADVTGMGLVALALLLGRPLGPDEFPHRLPELLNQARERTALGDEQPLSQPLRAWLGRTLQLDPRRAFASGPEALSALEDVVAQEPTYAAAPVALEAFLSRYTAALLEPSPPDIRQTFAVADVAASEVVRPDVRQSFSVPTPAVPDPPRHREPAQPTPTPVVQQTPPRVDPWKPHVPAALAQPAVPDFVAEFRRELERDAALAETSPVRHATQHVTPAKREAPSRVDRPVASLGSVKPAAREPREPRESESRKKSPLPFEPDLHAALAEPWIEPPSTPRPPLVVPPPGEFPKFEVRPSAAEVVAITARDIDELISTKDLTPEPQPASVRGPADVRHPAAPRANPWLRTAALLAIIVALAGVGVFASRYYSGRVMPAAPAMGTVLVQSRPAGVQVVIDGVDRGMTPARISVTPGAHILELRGRGVPRVIPVNVAAGAQISHYIEFSDTPATGKLSVQSQPQGARVIVDGVDRGVTPITIGDLTPGDHEVVFQNDAGTVRHVVTVEAGATASLVAPLVGSGPVSGWVSIKVPFTVEVREDGRLVGTSDSERLMMAAGRHELEFVNETLGYRATRVVQVAPGRVSNVAVELPKGIVNLNALPWAEVWIDGARVGETPIGNLAVPIGPHEIIFRHPQYGEKRHAISVTLSTPVRVSVDMK
jgi:serine/threonine protein kinase